MTTDRILPGVALMLAFCMLAPLLDVSSKLAAATIPVGQITAARFLVQGALMLPVALIMRLAWAVSPRMAGLILLRAIFLILSTYCFVAAIRVMPIADTLAITFVEPFILLLLGRLLFGDEVGPRRIAASMVGFGGALLVIQPSLAVFGEVALYPLGTAFFFAFYMLITRFISTEVHPVTMQMHTSIAGTLICIPGMALLDGTGIPSLAPLHYVEIVAAVALGYLVFSDFPNAMTWAGIAVIVSSGLYIIHRERIVARGRRATAATAAAVQ